MCFGGFLRSSRGNVAVMFSLAAVPLMIAAGSAVDYSRSTMARTQLQAVADSAALAAARAAGANPARSQHGLDMFRRHLASESSLAALNPEINVRVAQDLATTTVRVRHPNVFLNLVGIEDFPIDVEAQARLNRSRPVCFLALDQAASPAIAITGAAGINAPGCVVQANSTATNSITMVGAGRGVAQEFCTVGSYTARGSGFQPPPVGACSKVEDPLVNLQPPPPGNAHCTERYGPGDTIPANIDLAAGQNLCIEERVLARSGSTVLRLRGGTIHLIGNNSGLDITGTALVDVAAPRTGPYAGLAVVQHGVTVRGTSTITGTGDVNFTGTLYMPNQHVNMRGTGQIGATSPAWSVIAATFDIRGTPDIVFNADFEAAGCSSPIFRTMGGVVLVK